MKYKTVVAPSAQVLDEKVQELLDANWFLCGTPYQVGNETRQCLTTEDPNRARQNQDQGITADDAATIALLMGRGRRFY